MRTLAASAFSRLPRARHMRKFIVLTPGRSGSTLLLDLLASHPKLAVPKRELFHQGDVGGPIAAARHGNWQAVIRQAAAEAARQRASAWGWSLHPQHFAVHGIADGAAWCRQQHDDGVRFITLIRRDTLGSALSGLLATGSGTWHWVADGNGNTPPPSVRVDPQRLIEQTMLMDDAADAVQRCIGDLSHLALDYEDDLADAEQQQVTVNRVFAYLGLAPHAAATQFRRPARPLAERIENYDEVVSALAAAGHHLPS